MGINFIFVFMKTTFFSTLFLLCFFSLQAQKREAKKYLTQNEELKHTHIGISIYDPAKDKVLYAHNTERYFTVASNNKLYTLYAAKRYLTDSTTGIQYQRVNDTLYIRGTGDPTLLHPDFDDQPVYGFLKAEKLPIAIVPTKNKNGRFGPEWAWDYYNAGWQPERSSFPIYGNIIRFYNEKGILKSIPSYFSAFTMLKKEGKEPPDDSKLYVQRNEKSNYFNYRIRDRTSSHKQSIPFIPSDTLIARLLQDTLKKPVTTSSAKLADQDWKNIGNVPLDSLLTPMMHHSDNFMAEQTQYMVSMALFNEINSVQLIDHLKKYDFKFSDKPVLKDGSGLSFADMSSPNDLITILKLLYAQVDHEKLYDILPTGNTGTLEGLYKNLNGKLFAKTGTLNKAVALSGYLHTQKGRTLFISVVINGLTESYNVGRKQTEKFIEAVYKKY